MRECQREDCQLHAEKGRTYCPAHDTKGRISDGAHWSARRLRRLNAQIAEADSLGP